MIYKLIRSGNSVIVKLPIEVLEAIGLAVGDEVDVLTDIERGRITIEPVSLQGVRPSLLEKVDRFVDRYHSALDTLACT